VDLFKTMELLNKLCILYTGEAPDWDPTPIG